jgi:hypothetical protein
VTDLALLRDADPAAARAFFEDAPAEELVAAIRATDDVELETIVARDEIRPVAVEVLLSRLHEYAVLERLAVLRGLVRFDLGAGGRVLERHGLALGGGEIVPRYHLDPRDPADVVLTSGVLCFLRLVSGERNAGLEYLAGTLDIDGDAALALGVGAVFQVPGTGRTAMDPTQLDPVDVASVIAHVPSGHLRKVMESEFRPVVLGEIFRRLPEFVDEHKARGVALTVGFRLLGNPSGDVDRFVVRVRDGRAEVSEGETGDVRDATITCQGHDYVRLATGHLNPVLGVLKGTLKVKGDKAKALQLSSILDIPTAR